jgi:hypothetical protein
LGRRRAQRGQALVEFSLTILIFMTIFVAIAEFAFFLTVKIGVTNTAQDTVQLAAELGNTPYSDMQILQLVEKDVSAPLDRSKIQSVEIIWTDSYGVANYGEDRYDRSGSLTRNSITVPYSPGTATYPEGSRCNVIAGCPGHVSVDYIAVKVTYQYTWVTPLPGLAGLSSSPPIFVQSSISRLEPIQ